MGLVLLISLSPHLGVSKMKDGVHLQYDYSYSSQCFYSEFKFQLLIQK